MAGDTQRCIRRSPAILVGAAGIDCRKLTVGGGEINGPGPSFRQDGQPLASVHIALQSGRHPIRFRRTDVLYLKGCVDAAATNYRPWFVEPDPENCRS